MKPWISQQVQKVEISIALTYNAQMCVLLVFFPDDLLLKLNYRSRQLNRTQFPSLGIFVSKKVGY